MGNLSTPLVSVIIPVFNDSQRLKSCLEALENQTYSKSLYEVVVIDNGSDEDIKIVVEHFKKAFAVYENRPSSYAARNKGLAVAKGEIIAFTDADCIPAPDWIEKGVAHLLHTPGCGLVAGRINLFFRIPNKPTIAELYESITAFPQKENIEKYRYGATANCFTFKSVIDKVGDFDDTLKSGGDYEWGQRIFLAGYKQIYVDDVCIKHPARHSLAELYQKNLRIYGGARDMNLLKTSSPLKEFLADVSKDLLPPFRLYFRILLDKKFLTNREKFQYLIGYVFLKYAKVWIKIWLRLGGKSTRA